MNSKHRQQVRSWQRLSSAWVWQAKTSARKPLTRDLLWWLCQHTATGSWEELPPSTAPHIEEGAAAFLQGGTKVPFSVRVLPVFKMTQRHMGSCELENSWLKFQPSSQTKRDFILKSGILKLWLLLELDYVLMEMGLNFYGFLFRNWACFGIRYQTLTGENPHFLK